jgi:hypothetical protein
MAVPGETTCRPVAPCGPAKYDGIPVDATTQFVDASFIGTSDGSESAPWTTIGDGIANAAFGGIVAVAAGTYAEVVDISVTAVELWGVCPEQVTISPPGTDAMTRAITIRNGAHGTEVHRVGITSMGIGVGVFTSSEVVLDEIWIHDTGFVGLGVQGTVGPTQVTLSRSLMEDSMTVAALCVGEADLAIDESVIRGSRYDGNTISGLALWVEPAGGALGNATVKNSVMEKNDGGAVYIQGATGAIETSVLRDNGTTPHAPTISIGPYMGQPGASATIRSSVVERSGSLGVLIHGADAVIETTTVRDVTESAVSPREGFGVIAKSASTTTLAKLTMSSSLVERVKQVGIGVIGTDATIDRTLVREVTPVGNTYAAFGVTFYEDPETLIVGTLGVTASVVENVTTTGIVVQSAPATIDSVRVSNMTGIDALYGDGVNVRSDLGPGSLTLTRSLVERSARAGLASFGSSVTVSDTTFECNYIAIDGEFDFQFYDQGGNVCGCEQTVQTCKALTSMLEPPPAPQ